MAQVNHIVDRITANNDRWEVTRHEMADGTYQVRGHVWDAEPTGGVYQLHAEPLVCRHRSALAAENCAERMAARFRDDETLA